MIPATSIPFRALRLPHSHTHTRLKLCNHRHILLHLALQYHYSRLFCSLSCYFFYVTFYVSVLLRVGPQFSTLLFFGWTFQQLPFMVCYKYNAPLSMHIAPLFPLILS